MLARSLILIVTTALAVAATPITPSYNPQHIIRRGYQPSYKALDGDDAKPYSLDRVDLMHSEDKHNSASSTTAHDATTGYGYLFTHFTSTDEDVYFHLSDGDSPLNFTELNHGKQIVSSNVGAGAARDPFIVVNPISNQAYLLGNNQSFIKGNISSYDQAFNQGYDGIVVFDGKSDDFTKWAKPRLLTVAPKDNLHVFAPEAIWIPEQKRFLIHWSGATKADPVQRIYGAYTTDFKTVSKPFLYFTEGTTGVGDLTLFKLNEKAGQRNNSYVRFYRSDVADSSVRGQISENGIFGSWRDIAPLNVSAPATVQQGNNQAPLIYKTHNTHKDEFLIWVRGAGYQAYETEDIRVLPYSPVTAEYFPRDAEQGQVLSLTRAQHQSLKHKLYDTDKPDIGFA